MEDDATNSWVLALSTPFLSRSIRSQQLKEKKPRVNGTDYLIFI